jgi:hypothetical protein
LALLFGKGRQQEEDEEEKGRGVSKQASKEHVSGYLRFVLVGDHRALAKARSQTHVLRLGEDRASYLWPGKQAVQLAIPETATRFLSGDLSLVVEAFQQGLNGKKDVMLARGVVHHFMEHLQKAEAPRVLVLPLVSTSPLIGNGSRSTTTKMMSKHHKQDTQSEVCIRLAYLPLAPPCQCRITDGEGSKGTSDKAKHGGICKQGVNEQVSEGKEEGKDERVTNVDDVKTDEGSFSRNTPPESKSEESVRVRQQRQQEKQEEEEEEEEGESPKIPAEEGARVLSVSSNLHLDLAASLIEQIRHEQESDAPPVHGEEVVRSSEQEEEVKVVEAPAHVEVAVPGFRTPSSELALQAEMVAHCEAASATEQGHGGRTTAAAVLQEKRAGKDLYAPVGEGRRRRICKSLISTARRKAQLLRINKLLADLEALPTTLKNEEWIRGHCG